MDDYVNLLFDGLDHNWVIVPSTQVKNWETIRHLGLIHQFGDIILTVNRIRADRGRKENDFYNTVGNKFFNFRRWLRLFERLSF